MAQPAGPSQPGMVPTILGVLALHYLMALLVIQSGTRLYRLLLLPLAVGLPYHAASTYDVSGGDPEWQSHGYNFAVVMLGLSLRMVDWAFRHEPLRRRVEPDPRNVYLRALDLATTLRGVGWTWSTPIPPETRPTTSPFAFWLATLRLSAVNFAVHFGSLTLLRISCPAATSAAGGSIYLRDLPFLPMHMRAITSALLHTAAIFSSMDAIYYLITALAFTVPGLRRYELWPRLSDAPWRAASLGEFWTRWHQLFRAPFVTFGARPGYKLAGRAGAVLGAFGVSAALHYVCLFGGRRGSDLRVALFFGAQALGVLAEEACVRVVGARVSGWAGRAWTALFLALTAPMLVDAWMMKGFTAGAHQVVLLAEH